MTEYWKASPNYWCKHCAVFVRDTKLERQNHEATAKHQNAIKRSLRDLHRTHEREERDKERARREIDRLNAAVASSSSGPSRLGRASAAASSSKEASLKRQREQLAEMGVAIPEDFRGEMAMPGEWTVTSSRVIEGAGDAARDKPATGVRKREERGEDEEEEEEDAVKGLFKKPRRWGRDSRRMPEEEDEELDALLSGTVQLKAERGDVRGVKPEEGAVEAGPETTASVPGEEVKDEASEAKVKEEVAGDGGSGVCPVVPAVPVVPVVFKKRKPKGLRTK
ncbi:U1 zinc finger family protein [Metarhizium album ARSEF 1941]|uniref:U1 zinc finger family protein n=1 Tax=Metarhizium album (strain ARSEF 1941) TaxID=1081103 RepID=A0A0B2WIR4_METAS|nr:U1 zinc finger family protein [Metarhizium album ARSEF 1941]KHN95931.1 U1 zinc finger family protein [Metarhizium album ARSEF 1941]